MILWLIGTRSEWGHPCDPSFGHGFPHNVVYISPALHGVIVLVPLALPRPSRRAVADAAQPVLARPGQLAASRPPQRPSRRAPPGASAVRPGRGRVHDQRLPGQDARVPGARRAAPSRRGEFSTLQFKSPTLSKKNCRKFTKLCCRLAAVSLRKM